MARQVVGEMLAGLSLKQLRMLMRKVICSQGIAYSKGVVSTKDKEAIWLQDENLKERKMVRMLQVL
jgi:hypothetical protein